MVVRNDASCAIKNLIDCCLFIADSRNNRKAIANDCSRSIPNLNKDEYIGELSQRVFIDFASH